MSSDRYERERSRAAEPLERLLRASDPCCRERSDESAGGSGSEISLIDLVLLACDASEDALEVNDLVDSVIESGAARLLPEACDPMMVRADSSSSSARAA